MSRPRKKTFGDKSKLHLHICTLRGKSYTILMPRPSIHIRWSNNFFHNTWHILGTMHSAQFLGHLMWDLAFHKNPRTYVYIDPSLLVANPFDAQPAKPILIGQQRPPKALCLYLKRKRRSSHKTYRIKSQGLLKLLHDESAWNRFSPYYHNTYPPEVSLIKGVITISGSCASLKEQALWITSLVTEPGNGHYNMAFHFFQQKDRVDGEVQIFHDFYHRVGEAKQIAQQVRQNSPLPQSPTEEADLLQHIQQQVYKQMCKRHKRTL